MAELVTKFYYHNESDLTDETFWLNDCPVYPFDQAFQKNVVASQFQDGYVTTRPSLSLTLSIFTLNFVAVSERDMFTALRLETLVGGSWIFDWLPMFALNEEDYVDYAVTPPVLEAEVNRIRSVRLASPIVYSRQSFQLYNFTMNLQEAVA